MFWPDRNHTYEKPTDSATMCKTLEIYRKSVGQFSNNFPAIFRQFPGKCLGYFPDMFPVIVRQIPPKKFRKFSWPDRRPHPSLPSAFAGCIGNNVQFSKTMQFSNGFCHNAIFQASKHKKQCNFQKHKNTKPDLQT